MLRAVPSEEVKRRLPFSPGLVSSGLPLRVSLTLSSAGFAAPSHFDSSSTAPFLGLGWESCVGVRPPELDLIHTEWFVLGYSSIRRTGPRGTGRAVWLGGAALGRPLGCCLWASTIDVRYDVGGSLLRTIIILVSYTRCHRTRLSFRAMIPRPSAARARRSPRRFLFGLAAAGRNQ